MNVNIQTVHFDADSKLVELVTRRLEKLNTFHDRIIKVDVYLKLDNLVHTIKDKIAEIRVHVPRHNFFVKASSKSFEESFDAALDSLVNQIKPQIEAEARKGYIAESDLPQRVEAVRTGRGPRREAPRFRWFQSCASGAGRCRAWRPGS